MPRRARISDNDPLNPTRTEKVPERFERSNQPTREPVEQSTSQQDTGEQLESEEAEQSTSQQVKKIPEDPSLSETEQAENITSQPDDKTAAKATSTQTRSPAKKSASQKVDPSASHQETRQPASIATEDSASYQVDKPTSQQEDLPAVEFKKATFQLDKAVLTKLERFVLGLQLELGKENAPYKEVIVEEAIERLLNNDPAKILKALERRQKRRN
jgi:hypothetical protein